MIKSKKILMMTRYGKKGASSRYRFYDFKSFFDKQGYQCDINPLLDDSYLTKRYGKNPIWRFSFLVGYIKRFLIALKMKNYDLVFIEKELFPYLPYWIEAILLFRIHYALDYDDAIFHSYSDGNKITRFILGNKIKNLIAKSKLVVSGNDYLHDYAVQSGAPRSFILQTKVNLRLYDNVVVPKKKQFTIVWIGSPSTASYIEVVENSLVKFCNEFSAKFIMIGGKYHIDGLDIDYLDWSPENEMQILKSCHVGIMPLFDKGWERGKCGFKLIQYMASQLPVIASPVGINKDMVEKGLNGYLANSENEWFEALSSVFHSDSQMGKYGHSIVEKKHDLTNAAEFLINEISDLLSEIKNVENLESNLETDIILESTNIDHSILGENDELHNQTSYSVITICLNCANSIKRTIDSVMNQLKLPKQYIFVLGCSKDESYKEIMSHKEFIEGQGVKFVLIEESKKSRAGIPVAWNLGLDEIESDVVAILNADDFYTTDDVMSRVLEYFNDENCSILSGAIQYTNKSKQIANRSQQLFPFLNPCNHPATFVAKKLYDEIGNYNTSYIVSADYEFLYRAFALGYKLIVDNSIHVSMSPGGFASQNKKIGRYESYKIAANYSRFKIFPGLAYILRFLFRR
jgi:glycosyltransferase involved in cell wall biosynthesis